MLRINPKKNISHQRNKHHNGHWIVLNGIAEVQKDGKKIVLNQNETTYIPKGMNHILSNSGVIPLEIIEVQHGDYISEDDIERH